MIQEEIIEIKDVRYPPRRLLRGGYHPNTMKHTVLTGRCEELLPISCDLIVTDPPYGIGYCSGRQGIDRKTSVQRLGDFVVRSPYFENIVGDTELPTDWLPLAYDSLKTDGAIYIFCSWKTWGGLSVAVESAGFKIKNLIVVNKSNHGMGDLKGSYAPKHEFILFAVKGKHVLHPPRISDVWDMPVKFSGSKRLHPNEKPISWILPCIEHSSNEGDTVLDPFAGSGTVAIACKMLGRKSISI
ncbi:MAG: site-specific DNA-methyltransferase, partial [Candidatus Izemoplasmatales bacterium]|nr:site-specific DNA-methyltransferase [Candidatus Izemoplasmatales bacterium]